MHILAIIAAFGFIAFGILIPFGWGWQIEEVFFGSVFAGSGLMVGIAADGLHRFLFYCLIGAIVFTCILATWHSLWGKPADELPESVTNS